MNKATLNYSVDEKTGVKSLSLSAAYISYSADKAGLVTVKKTVCANAKNEKCIKAGGDGNKKTVSEDK